MSNGAVGFGAVGGLFGDQGVSPPQQVNDQTTNDDIHAIKERYCQPPLEDPQPFNLTAMAAPFPATCWKKFDLSQTVHNSIIVNVESGTVRLYLGDFVGDASTIGHITIPSGAPFQFVFSPKTRIYTLANQSAAAVATGSVIFVNT